MKFRKRPIVVDAVQLTWQTWGEVCDFAGVGELVKGKPQGFTAEGGHIGMHIPTLEGVMIANENDWIIKEPNPTGDRDFYPCKPDIFEATYEKVEENGI